MCNCQQLYLFFFGAEFEEPEDFRETIETLVDSEKLLVPRIPHKAKDISEVPRIPYWANRWFYAEFEEPTFFKIYLSSFGFSKIHWFLEFRGPDFWIFTDRRCNHLTILKES